MRGSPAGRDKQEGPAAHNRENGGVSLRKSTRSAHTVGSWYEGSAPESNPDPLRWDPVHPRHVDPDDHPPLLVAPPVLRELRRPPPWWRRSTTATQCRAADEGLSKGHLSAGRAAGGGAAGASCEAKTRVRQPAAPPARQPFRRLLRTVASGLFIGRSTTPSAGQRAPGLRFRSTSFTSFRDSTSAWPPDDSTAYLQAWRVSAERSGSAGTAHAGVALEARLLAARLPQKGCVVPRSHLWVDAAFRDSGNPKVVGDPGGSLHLDGKCGLGKCGPDLRDARERVSEDELHRRRGGRVSAPGWQRTATTNAAPGGLRWRRAERAAQ